MESIAETTLWRRITPELFSSLFSVEGQTLFPSTLRALEKADTRFREASQAEYERHLLNYFALLQREEIIRDTAQNYEAWLRGWTLNLNEILAAGPSAETCKPKYFRGSEFLRWRKGLVVTPNPQLEHDLFVVARHQIFNYWLRDYSAVHELGCGSCGNLWLLQEIFPDKTIRGYDWVEPSCKIASEIGRHTGRDVAGARLNFLEPPAKLAIEPNAAVISIHALEQIGDQFGPLLQSILNSKPALVLHYEPILDLYDPANVLDALARWYSEKRRYLKGFLPALHKLRDEGKIEILQEHRPGLGGILHEMSLIVWRPI